MINDENSKIKDEVVEVEIDVRKSYKFPKEIKIIKYKKCYLVVYTEGVKWIVLKNSNELKVFKSLQAGMCIEDVLDDNDEESVMNVIIQIEAKKFDEAKKILLEQNNMYIYLTNNCNQRCKHCYMYAGEKHYEELSCQQWLEFISNFKKAGGHGITFTGGEVTVYKGFDIIIKHAHDIGLSVTVLSNGILWTKELIYKLSNYIDEIQVSIDGYDKDSYYSVRRYDGFEKAMETIRLFCDRGTHVSMAVTPLYDNLDVFLYKFEIFARDFINRYPNVYIKLNMELLDGREVILTKSQNVIYKKKITELINRIYPNYFIEKFVTNFPQKSIRYNCGFGEISVAPNGDVFWCNRIHELSSNMNVITHSIDEILAVSKQIKKKTSVDNTKECKKCAIRYICGGGCRMDYNNITDVDSHKGEWVYSCNVKEKIYDKMILSNEYFYEG